jgi:hypothetical protein
MKSVALTAAMAAAAVFAEPKLVKFPVDVVNAGFEDGKTGWSGGKSMGVDEAVAHGGKKSMRIVVADPKKDSVYVTQNIPVKGGGRYEATCFVKTENVESAPGRMSSVGAGLIVEWADKKGRWMAGGQYHCGRWGTSDWKQMECKAISAPENAGYAIVYLTLRAKGTAWFDDVTFSEVRVVTDKIAPADGAVISNNCPRFVWGLLPGVRRYFLELSRDPSFPDGAVRTFDAGGLSEFQMEEPLEPGVWHWRVSSKGSKDYGSSKFTQTASVECDCLPPIVLTKAARITDSDQAFVVRVKDSCRHLPELVFHGVSGRYAGSDGGDTLQYSFTAPAGGWRKGVTEGEITARDAAGNCAATTFWLLNAPKPDNAVTVEADGSYHQSGKRIFPLGIYEVAPKYMAEVRASGYDVVHTYRWESNQDDVACRKYLDSCWAADGLRAFIGFDRGGWSKKGIVQGNLKHIAHRVGALADHPGLFCWYLFDEPEIFNQFVSSDKLTEFADLIRALDPYHPVVMTTWNKTMNEYRRTWDTHWTQAYGNPAAVVRQLEEHRRFLENASPITLLVNCNDQAQGSARKRGIEPDPEKFSRDYDHMRACAFLGIVKECNGLWWWWFARDTRDFYTAAQVPKAWANLVKVVKEIGALRPLVTADGPVASGSAASGKDRVEWWAKTVDGKTTVIAVNTADKPVSVELSDSSFGSLKMDLGRYEVRICNPRP